MAFNRILFFNFYFILIASVISSDLRHILPQHLKIREGEDLQLRLTSILAQTVSCYIKTPLLTSYNLNSEEPDSNSRLSYWTESGECGAKVRSVTKEDAGRWRLTAKNTTNTLVNSVFVEVLDKISPQEQNLTIESGVGYTLTLDNESKYCRITQPHSDKTILVNGDCKVDLNQPTAAVEGTWSAMTGVVGQLEEVPVNVELNVVRDRLITGFTRNTDANTISVYCNLRDAAAGLVFCRFGKPGDAETGFQLTAGLSSGRYGYYGAGLDKGACGIRIETPTTEDYGQWRCFVGIKGEEPFGAYIQVHSNNHHTAMSRGAITLAEAPSSSSAITSLGEKLQLRCEASVPISYCRFVGPNGEIFRPRQSIIEQDASYSYIGEGFGKGQCGMEIKTAATNHNGQWTCHMGPEELGFELSSQIEVRIAETPLAAMVTQIIVSDRETLTLECRTVPERVSIEYCRFVMPDGTGIHIGDDITEKNPLVLDNSRYWFSGSSLRLGGCGLKVDRISHRHIGKWTCAAQLEHTENNSEAFDTINIQLGEPADATPSIASATGGIVTGVVLSVLLLTGVSVYVVKRWKARRSQQVNNPMEIFSLPSDSRRSSTSTNSDTSMRGMVATITRA